jgi:hypothetical protein
MRQFFQEIFWKWYGDYRLWAPILLAITALMIGAIRGVTGWSVLQPVWLSMFFAMCCAVWIALRVEWLGYVQKIAKIECDMPLNDALAKLVGTNDFKRDGIPLKIRGALDDLREKAYQGDVLVWGAKCLGNSDDGYAPRGSIDQEYWEDFGIDYECLIQGMPWRTVRLRGRQKEERVANSVTTQMHTINVPDRIYTNLYLSKVQANEIRKR